MSKTGQARVLTPEQFARLLSEIKEHRHKEKNTALIQVSFKLGLRVQEIALLQIKDVAELGPEVSGLRTFKLKEILALPAAYTKGADALERSKSAYHRRRISFSVHDFDNCQWPLILTHFWPIKLTHLRTANRRFSASVDSSHLPA